MAQQQKNQAQAQNWETVAQNMGTTPQQSDGQEGDDVWSASSAPQALQTVKQRLLGNHPISDTIGSIGTHLKNFVAGPYHAFTDAPQNDEERYEAGGDGALSHFGLGVARMFVNPTKDAIHAAINEHQAGKNSGPEYDSQGNYTPTALSSAMDAIPIVGPWARSIDDEAHKSGALPALAGFGTDVAGAEAVGKLPEAGGRWLGGDINKPIPGQGITPAERYAAAKRMGVQFDAADATDSPFFKGLKRINEHSLFGGNVYDEFKAKNASALKDSMGQTLDGMFDGDHELGGREVQQALKANQSGLQQRSTDVFDNLPQDVPLTKLRNVGKRAQQMVKDNEGYQSMFPSLAPSRAMSVINDVAGIGPQSAPPIRMSPFIDESGDPIPSSSQEPRNRKPLSFGTGQQLRSDLLEFGRKNPDIVAGQGDAMVRELAGHVDDAMMDGATRLTPGQREAFRKANADWKDMKETYDDPSSPYYHAVRTTSPSTLFAGVGPKTPENAVQLVKRLSPDETQSRALGAVRRGTVESALKPTATDVPNYKNFGLQWNRIPEAYRAGLFDLDQSRTLKDFANTANVIGKDVNPSQSAVQGQKVAEGAAMVSTKGLPALQYPLAKIMTNPTFVEKLMKPRRPNPFFAPAAESTMTAGAHGGRDR